MDQFNLELARYGKHTVRVYKVMRNAETGVQDVCEMTLNVMLEGEIEASWTHADNTPIVATDSIKNTVYILAKEHAVTPPEYFAALIGKHFNTTYPHIHATSVSITVHRWTRMVFDGVPHPHSFIRDGEETRTVEARIEENGPTTITSGIKGMLVLKSTGSQFHGYVKDEYTTLPETWDRVLSTSVDCTWEWAPFPTFEAVEANKDFDSAWESARRITMKTFADEDSASVQDTTYKMACSILAAVPGVDGVRYELPNKHYFEINLSWHKGIKNTGKDAEVYAPQWGPSGTIQCYATRKR
ncbi:uricase [Rhizodiscina lignyota]|uniref:Uricase n=1 Tax=Rhizodiscina lignyota TaxID=1504668 RepID=A0A9P4IPP6_9PEZI|nr:uricase [Rhizodiscina lignyota]